MKTILLLAIVTVASAQQSTHDPFYCFSRDPIRPQTSRFSTVAAYEPIRHNAVNPSLSSCRPSKFWMLSRGGTQTPSTQQIRDMRALSEDLINRVQRSSDQGRDQLCREDLERILSWRFNETVTEDRFWDLTGTGWDELRNLAVRYQRAFPSLLPETYNAAQFRFRRTYRQKTLDSIRAFSEGLFGHSNVVVEDVPEVDMMLSNVDTCDLYQEWASNFAESNAFADGVDFSNTVDQVNRKLGLFGSNSLSTAQVMIVWDYCRFEQGWNPSEASPWCAAFSLANNEALEYFQDLRLSDISGYTGDVTLFGNMGCHALQDLLQFVESNNPDDHLARIHVTRSTVTRIFYVTLDLFRDAETLNRHNFAQQFARAWRTSLFSSFASNFVVAQHQCDSGDHDLLIFQNERPILIPGCESPGLCKQSTFVNLFRRFLNANCDELYCSRNWD